MGDIVAAVIFALGVVLVLIGVNNSGNAALGVLTSGGTPKIGEVPGLGTSHPGTTTPTPTPSPVPGGGVGNDPTDPGRTIPGLTP